MYKLKWKYWKKQKKKIKNKKSIYNKCKITPKKSKKAK